MQVFASTTFHGPGRTAVADALDILSGLDVDGVELGSTHRPQADLPDAVRRHWSGRIVTHNFFPPAEDESFILNLAATDDGVRGASLAHSTMCLRTAAALGAELYTVHPGFLAEPLSAASERSDSFYDFTFDQGRVPYEEAAQRMRESLAQLLEVARAEGVALAIETEGSITKQGVLLMERPEEYDAVLADFPDLKLTFNLAHTTLASKVHGFAVGDFVRRFGDRFAAVELSHNDGHSDQHAPLVPGSYILDWVPVLPDVPLILEFRDASPAQMAESVALVRATAQKELPK